MSFLEYVAERLMGPPVYGSSWHCPFHSPDEHPSFSIRPPKPGFKVRFKCFACGQWGDEFDLAKLFYPNETYGDRRYRVSEWREEYEAEISQHEPQLTLHRGAGGAVDLLEQLLAAGHVNEHDLLEVLAELRHERALYQEFIHLSRRPIVRRFLAKQKAKAGRLRPRLGRAR